MTTSPPSIIGTQTIALQRFTSILPELARIFSTVEVVSLATAFANTASSVKGKLAVWKLVMFLQLVKGFIRQRTVTGYNDSGIRRHVDQASLRTL